MMMMIELQPPRTRRQRRFPQSPPPAPPRPLRLAVSSSSCSRFFVRVQKPSSHNIRLPPRPLFFVLFVFFFLSSLLLVLLLSTTTADAAAAAATTPQSLPQQPQPVLSRKNPNSNHPKNMWGGWGGSSMSSMDSRMPSLFVAPDEVIYDRYAACLAATEGLRRLRDRELAEPIPIPIPPRLPAEAPSSATSSSTLTSSSSPPPRPHTPSAAATAAAAAAATMIERHYKDNAQRVLRALGMTVQQFNDVSVRVSTNDALRERVLEQAYLYRMAATIHMDKLPLVLPHDNDNDNNDNHHRKEGNAGRRRLRSPLLSSFSSGNHHHKNSHDDDSAAIDSPDKIELFCHSMTEIEHLRETQIERLKKSLRVQEFPPPLSPFHMSSRSHNSGNNNSGGSSSSNNRPKQPQPQSLSSSASLSSSSASAAASSSAASASDGTTIQSLSDPRLLPFLSPKVRAVLEAFPLQAQEILHKHGLASEEFNHMLDETRSNPVFRWKVQKQLRNHQLQQQQEQQQNQQQQQNHLTPSSRLSSSSLPSSSLPATTPSSRGGGGGIMGKYINNYDPLSY